MKTILIVGASKGIGNALLSILVEHHKVISLSRTAPTGTYDNLTHHDCDITKDELPLLPALDNIVYCPGSINLKPFTRLTTEDFSKDYKINVLGAVRVIQAYLPILKNGIHPAILLFSSVATNLGMPFHTSIAAAKSAVEGLVKSLAAELAPTIRVNAIAPTVTDTPLAAKLLRNDKMKENIKERHPLKKYLDPTEVANFAEFLISEKANALTGHIYPMDCGILTIKP